MTNQRRSAAYFTSATNVDHRGDSGTCVASGGLLGPTPRHATIIKTLSSDTFRRGINALMMRLLVPWSRKDGALVRVSMRMSTTSDARPRIFASCDSPLTAATKSVLKSVLGTALRADATEARCKPVRVSSRVGRGSTGLDAFSEVYGVIVKDYVRVCTVSD
jgi:hypothetical protein